MAERLKIRTINKIHKAVSFPWALQIVLNQHQHLRQCPSCSRQPRVPVLSMQIEGKGLVSIQALDVNRFHSLWSCCGTKPLSFCGFAKEPTRRDEKGVAQCCLKCLNAAPHCKTQRTCTITVNGDATLGSNSNYKWTICFSVG